MKTKPLFDKDQEYLTAKAGEIIFRAGDPATRMFGVVEGKVDITINGNLMETVEPGGFFGEMAIIEEKPRNATATAKTDTKLASIDQVTFLFLVQRNPRFALQLMTIMASRLRRMDERL